MFVETACSVNLCSNSNIIVVFGLKNCVDDMFVHHYFETIDIETAMFFMSNPSLVAIVYETNKEQGK